MELRADGLALANGAEIGVTIYDANLIDGLEGDLRDGETFTFDDGCTVTRHGDEMVWVTPARADNRRG